MSWSSKALPWLIPSLLLATPVHGTVVVVSPWIENVEIQVFYWKGSITLHDLVPFTDVIRWLHEERDIKFSFYVREDQLRPDINWRIVEVHQETGGIADFYGIPHLHAKLLVTDTLVLETSANLLANSLYKNIETVTVHSNPDADARIYTKHFFTRHGLLVP